MKIYVSYMFFALFIIFGLVLGLVLDINQSNKVETITKCYDDRGNEIVGISCVGYEESPMLIIFTFFGMLISILAMLFSVVLSINSIGRYIEIGGK